MCHLPTSVTSYRFLFPNCTCTVSPRPTSVISDEERIEVTDASVRALSTGLLQRCASKNSWHCNKTAAINSEYGGWFSVGSKTAEPYHYSTQYTLPRSPYSRITGHIIRLSINQSQALACSARRCVLSCVFTTPTETDLFAARLLWHRLSR